MQRPYRVYGTYVAVEHEIGRSPSSASRYVQMKGDPQNVRIAVNNLMQNV